MDPAATVVTVAEAAAAQRSRDAHRHVQRPGRGDVHPRPRHGRRRAVAARAASGQSGNVLPAGGSAVADFDGDGVTDAADACPTTPRGTADANADGCPEPPITTLTSGPLEDSFVLSTSATLGFSSSEPSSTFTCSLDDQAGSPL